MKGFIGHFGPGVLPMPHVFVGDEALSRDNDGLLLADHAFFKTGCGVNLFCFAFVMHFWGVQDGSVLQVENDMPLEIDVVPEALTLILPQDVPSRLLAS